MSTSPFSRPSGGTQVDDRPKPAEQPESAQVAAAWFVDPLDRFDGRYFDGEQWTDQISDNGVLRHDPDWPLPTAAAETDAPTPPTFDGADRRGAYDRRQITIKVDHDRRKSDRRSA